MSAEATRAATVVSTGIDWITATAPTGPKQTLLTLQAHRWRDIHESEGNVVRPWDWMGYTGQTMDSLSVGTRDDGTIVRLSGDLSRQYGPTVIRLAQRVSRIDLQVTIQDEGVWRNRAAECILAARRDRRVISGLTRTNLMDTTPDGATGYIGTRVSNRFFRCYDKSAESRGVYPVGCWRYEIEWKGARALSVGEALVRSGATPENCRQMVEAAFSDYGVHLPCLPLPTRWRDRSPREETTDERRLAWLERNVRPALERLLESCDRRMVLEAIGLITDGAEGFVRRSTGEVL